MRVRLLVAAAALTAGVAALVVGAWKLGLTPSPAPAPAAAIPAARPPPALPPPPPPPQVPPAPRAPTHVEVEFTSRPSGASVTRVDTGEVLGRTPLTRKLPVEKKDARFRFALDGYEPLTGTADLATGGSVNVALRPVPKPVARKPEPTSTRTGGKGTRKKTARR